MKRRAFITLLGGSAVGWPLAARAQQLHQPPIIGVLMQSAPDDTEYQTRLAVFLDQMQELGWKDGRNVRIVIVWGYRNPERIIAGAQELIDLQPSLILATNTITARALKKKTTSVPIIFAGTSDPLASGIVSSLAHPDGNVTGFSNYEFSMGGKWLELLKSVAPNLNKVLVLMQPKNDGNRGLMSAVTAAAHAISVQCSSTDVDDASALEREIPNFARESDAGLIVLPNPSKTRSLILSLAIRYKLPGVYPLPEMARAGGLMSYYIDYHDLYRGAATYVDRVLKGESIANLPVQQPTKFNLVINQKAAAALSLNVPQSLLSTADEVIE